MDAQYYIEKLGLSQHPEGGYYQEVFRSGLDIMGEALPPNHPGHTNSRAMSTSIYFLLPEGQRSHFHRLQSDEIWYYHAGGPTQVYIIHPNGVLSTSIIGPDLAAGQQLQVVMPANTWFAATPVVGAAFTLVGCMVAPGFDFADFELAQLRNLLPDHPSHVDLINQFCLI
jgi:predicted cupin superfamily sugar epimerase